MSSTPECLGRMQGLGLQDPPPHNSAILRRFIRPAVGVCKLGGAFPKCFQSRRPPMTLEKSIYIRSGFPVTPRIFLRLSAHHRKKKCFPTLGNHAVHHPRHLSPSGPPWRGPRAPRPGAGSAEAFLLGSLEAAPTLPRVSTNGGTRTCAESLVFGGKISGSRSAPPTPSRADVGSPVGDTCRCTGWDPQVTRLE